VIFKPVTFGHDINWDPPRGNTIRGERVLNGNPRDQRRPRLYIGVTDNDWFDVVSPIPDIDEVNFWQPGRRASTFKILQPGEQYKRTVYSRKGNFNHVSL
jgi:hypothetical protein